MYVCLLNGSGYRHPQIKMKFHIKQEIGNDPEFYRYFAEDEHGRYIDNTLCTCPINAPQEKHDFAVEAVVQKLKCKLKPSTIIKTIEI